MNPPQGCRFTPTYSTTRCGGDTEHGNAYCPKHRDEQCASCGAQATHGCNMELQFVCGSPLCDDCTHTFDRSRPSFFATYASLHVLSIKRPDGSVLTWQVPPEAEPAKAVAS